jgi:hypothetical protein
MDSLLRQSQAVGCMERYEGAVTGQAEQQKEQAIGDRQPPQ